MDKVIQSAIEKLETVAITPFIGKICPALCIIYKSGDKGAQSYLRSLNRLGNKYQCTIVMRQCDKPQEVSMVITEWIHNIDCNGIIILSDYGEATQALYDMIPTRLDIDGLSYKSVGRLYGSHDPLAYRKAPCTAVACLKIIQERFDNLEGLNVAVIGRSMRVGRPLAELLTQQNCTVTLYHSKSFYSNSYNNFQHADIIVSAIGKPKYWSADNIDGIGTDFIDVGINVDENGKVCGDGDYDSLTTVCNYVTPVPGGVGNMSTIVLFAKLFANKREMVGDAA